MDVYMSNYRSNSLFQAEPSSQGHLLHFHVDPMHLNIGLILQHRRLVESEKYK